MLQLTPQKYKGSWETTLNNLYTKEKKDNSEGTDKFLEIYNSPWLNYEEMEPKKNLQKGRTDRHLPEMSGRGWG